MPDMHEIYASIQYVMHENLLLIDNNQFVPENNVQLQLQQDS